MLHYVYKTTYTIRCSLFSQHVINLMTEPNVYRLAVLGARIIRPTEPYQRKIPQDSHHYALSIRSSCSSNPSIPASTHIPFIPSPSS
jgi:hypothetical protein